MASITSNYGLSKPLGSEAPDISVINDNMDTLDSELVVKTSNDIADATATKSTGWTTVLPVAVGEKVASVFEKFSTMAKNIRWIYKFLGTADISSIGDGTVTNALTTLNTAVGKKVNTADIVNNLTSTSTTQPLSANMGKTLNDALGGQWVVLPSGSSFNSLTSNARYYVGDLSANGNYPTGIGSTGSVEIQKMGSYIRQVVYTNLGEAYRFSYDNGASWSEWADTWVILATGTNLNTLVNNAKYMVGNMAAMVNGPSGKGSTGTLEIQRVRASYVRQIAYLNSGASYRFSYDNGGTWTGWA